MFPQLLRSLGSDRDEEAHWAGQLLRQASVPEVAVRLRKLLTSPQHPDSVKARALAILADLGLSPPQDVVLGDPEGFIARSVSELLQTIQSADDLVRTTNDLLTAVLSGLARLSSLTGEAERHACAVDALQRFLAGTLLVPVSRST